ncbi:hypothetical protein LINPERHAP1_LOCUS40613 [Linum perenne]
MADEFPDIPDLNNLPASEEPILFNNEDIQDSEDLAQRSLLMRIFWENPRRRLAIQASLNNQWNCNGQLRVFDAGLGLYQVLFPTVEKRNSILKNQPWGLNSSILHLAEFRTPSTEIFEQLRFMKLWIKLAGVPIDCQSINFGRRMLGAIGEVNDVGLFELRNDEGVFIKGMVKMDLLSSFLGRRLAKINDGRSFWVYFQYERIPSICFRCGYLGHNQARCPATHIPTNPESRGPWMIIPRAGRRLNPNSLLPNRQRHQNRSGMPHLPPVVAANMSSAPHRFSRHQSQTPWSRNDHHNLPIPLILALPAPVTKPPAIPATRSSPANIMRSNSNQTGNQEEQKKKRIIQNAKGKEPVHKTQKLEKPSYHKEVGISFKDPKPPADESEEEEDYSTTAESSWAPPPNNSNLEIGESSIANMLNNLDEFGSFLGDENVGSGSTFDSLEEEG